MGYTVVTMGRDGQRVRCGSCGDVRAIDPDVPAAPVCPVCGCADMAAPYRIVRGTNGLYLDETDCRYRVRFAATMREAQRIARTMFGSAMAGDYIEVIRVRPEWTEVVSCQARDRDRS